jgi:SAM-dependent methyltransferase
MQAYSQVFAKVYNMRWGSFVQYAAPLIQGFYERTPAGQENHTLLDLCCGTGQLAHFFLERGYRVTGLDLSEHMLQHAQENTAAYIKNGQARFVQGDAADFSLKEQFGLIVSTYDSLNHLESKEALQGCFRSVFRVLVEGGYFLFDLNTREGLKRWTNVQVMEDKETLIVTRGVYDDAGGRAYVQISGCVHARDGLYERFNETMYNTIFDMPWVREALLETGWREVQYARIKDLAAPIADPEAEDRTWFVARK